MALSFTQALDQFISRCEQVTVVHDLLTKWRLELTEGYVLDCYYNETFGRYSYALIKENQRIMGWDNAHHYPHLPNFPHHFHTPDHQVLPSSLTGNPEPDLEQVRLVVESFLRGEDIMITAPS
jgi:hypothetical protein